ncbi:MAG: endolytic transglycosylase MltG [Pseudomonadota bacterium]
MKHFAANAMTVLIVGCIALIGFALYQIDSFSAPGATTEPTRVTIESGSTLKEASDVLEEAGAIESATIFRLGARYKGLETELKQGEYEIPAGASMAEVLDIVTTGRSIQYRITVAEGLTSWEVVQILNESDLLTGEIVEVPKEGSLAPDTYFVSRGMSRETVIGRMRAAQEAILARAWELRDPDSPLASPEEALILASIIEKETGVAEERPLVGGVFVNRLRRGMRLQSDPTIIYGITNGEGPLDRPILRSDIRRATPYNTYTIDRLPPGPIANPGREAILAAVAPEETEALYFVADGTGGHAFANTLAEHERNVAAWRRIERERRNQ